MAALGKQMKIEEEKQPWLAKQTAHWAIVVAIMLAGALWLHLSRAHFVWENPIVYFLSPFLFLGMLIAELVGSATSEGWSRPTRNLAAVIVLLVALYVANQFFVMPLSTDLPMLTYLILRRRSISSRAAQWRMPEMWAGILMLALVVYIKVTFLPQPVKIISGVAVGLLLFAFDRARQKSLKQEGPTQPPPGAYFSKAADGLTENAQE